MRCLLALFFSLSLSAQGGLVSSWDCRGFAFLAEDVADPPALIQTTYQQLFDTIGLRVTPQTLRAMAQSGDPFALPEQDGHDISGLRKKLKEFEALIKKRGWDTQPLRAQLMTVLRDRAALVQVAGERVHAIIRGDWKDYVVVMPEPYEYTFSPDGRYLVTSVVSKTHSRIYRHDLDSRRTSEGRDVSINQRVLFAPDSEHLLYAGEEGTLMRTPFLDGKIDWRKNERIGPADLNVAPVAQIVSHPGGNLFYTWHQNRSGHSIAPKEGFYLHDRPKNTRVSIDFGKLHSFWRLGVRSWGLSRDGERLWVHADESLASLGDWSTLRVFKVAPDGKATLDSEWNFNDPEVRFVVWSADGKSALGFNKKLQLKTAPDPMAWQELEFPTSANGAPLRLLEAVAHPTENRAAVLFADDTKGQHTRLFWYDMKTGKRLGERKLPDESYDRLEFDAKGTKFVLHHRAQTAGLYIGNLEGSGVP